MDPTALLQNIAFSFQKTGHNLASAIAFAEIAKKQPDSALAWCGLGSALIKSAGVFVKKPFHESGVRCLKRCLALATSEQDKSYKDAAEDWLKLMAKEVDLKSLRPMLNEELEGWIDYLDIDPQTFSRAISSLPADDQMTAIMALGEQSNLRFLDTLLMAVKGQWGDGAARSALKRVQRFGDRPEIRNAYAQVVADGKHEELQPYFDFAAKAIDEPWAAKLMNGEIKPEAETEKKIQFKNPPAHHSNKPGQASDNSNPAQPKSKTPWWMFWK